MIKKKSDSFPSVAQATKSLRSAVRKLIAERKKTGGVLVVWRNGKAVKIPAKEL